MNYDFTSLSPSDFEDLAADLFSRAWGVRLESFKAGADGGIDLRHARVPTDTPTVLLQCKRYAPHKFAELLRAVKKERKNLERLNPERYILVTSVALSPGNKEQLVRVLTPWCVGPQDIYGPSELNGMLRDHPTVLHSHFKLWISQTAVLERVLHARIFAATEASLDTTKQQLSRLVVHDGLNRALDILRLNHHVVIVGNPGIGKTTLARMLMCHYVHEGFEAIWVTSNIDEAWTLVHSAMGTNRKYIIVYDDFLGQLQFDSVRFGKNEDQSLMALLNKAARSPNLRLILTTREYILVDARRVHGAFDGQADDLIRCTLSLEDYAKAHRAQMIFNHLYFSDLPDSRLSAVIESRIYRRLVEHKNFNPRVVESISRHANSRSMTDADFVVYIDQEFDNPARLWAHPFRNEISPIARQVLLALWSFRGQAELCDLQEVVEGMNTTMPAEELARQFTEAQRQLEGNFTQTSRYPNETRKSQHLIVKFQNPSVAELVDGIAGSEVAWLPRLAAAAITLPQIDRIGESAREQNSRHTGQVFWLLVRQRAERCESRPYGHIINLLRYGESSAMVTWSVSELRESELTRHLLVIESDVKVNDARNDAVKNRVLTREGWATALRRVPYDDSESYAAARLQKWIVEKSDWCVAEVHQSELCFRQALLDLLRTDGDSVEFPAMNALLEAASWVTPTFDAVYTAAIVESVRLRVAHLRSQPVRDNLDWETSDLKNLARLMSVDLSGEVTELEAYLVEGDPDVSWEAETPDRAYPSHEETPFDIDTLFAGMLDR